MKLVMVRHAKTDYNDNGLVQGMTDIPLNEEGIMQASRLKEKLKDIKFDLCFSSPLKRTLKTAKIIVGDDFPIITDELLIERNMGTYEGGSFKEYQKHDFWDRNKNYNINGVEPVRDIMKRTKIFLDNLKEKYPDKTILLVSHSATLRALHFNIVGYDNDTYFYSFKSENGEAYEYDI